MHRETLAVLRMAVSGGLLAFVSDTRNAFLPLSESPYASLMPDCGARSEADVGFSQYVIINPEVPFSLTRRFGVDSVTSTRQSCAEFVVVIEEFQSAEIAKRYLDARRDSIGLAASEILVQALDWPLNWDLAVSVDPWRYSEDGAVSVADYALIEIVVQVEKVTIEYSQYVAHDFFDGERIEFVPGL